MKYSHKQSGPPLQRLFDLGDLSQAGTEIAVEASPDERRAIAGWAGVDSIEAFTATVLLRRLSQTRFSFEADMAAAVTQSCVVTLEPVAAHIARRIARELHQVPRSPSGHVPEETGELTLSAGDDDVPEPIISLYYDLAAPLLEEFALAIDPYPRKDGAAFVRPAEPEVSQSSPFAVLKALKDRG